MCFFIHIFISSFKKSVLFLLILTLCSFSCTACPSQNLKEQVKTNREIKPQEKQKVIKKKMPVVHLSPRKIYPGDYLGVYIESLAGNEKIIYSTNLEGKKPYFFPYKTGRLALVAVNYRTNPGDYSIQVKIERAGHTVLAKEKVIHVLPKKFKTQYLEVTPDQKAKRNPKLWQEDAKHIAQAKSVSVAQPLWNSKFILPIEGRVSTEFGVIRYINNVKSGRHSGIDIAASPKTPIKATNKGLVTLSKALNVTGNTVIIDHGLNVFSAYAHLDRLLVKNGQMVEKGDIIGEVGSTGFSTGPHLHWTISIGPVFINPWTILEEDPLERIGVTTNN